MAANPTDRLSGVRQGLSAPDEAGQEIEGSVMRPYLRRGGDQARLDALCDGNLDRFHDRRCLGRRCGGPLALADRECRGVRADGCPDGPSDAVEAGHLGEAGDADLAEAWPHPGDEVARMAQPPGRGAGTFHDGRLLGKGAQHEARLSVLEREMRAGARAALLEVFRVCSLVLIRGHVVVCIDHGGRPQWKPAALRPSW